ncbi:MAG: winged helix-turn-helix transcriptional regulator [Candidatus Korarchaeota archaeon]|nr:winged helix-turn-helix transcriptional regulator [Candidatus Korarchaeota archaeon]
MYITRSKILKLKKILDALTSDAKLKILRRLLRSPASATDLAEEFGLTLPAIASHIKDLEDAGLIRAVERRRGRGRPAKMYTIIRKRITLDIDLEILLGLPDEEELERLMEEYVRRKVEEGVKKVNADDIRRTLDVNQVTARVIFDRLSSNPQPIIEGIAERIIGLLKEEKTTAELSKELNTDRWWISKAVKLLSDRGIVKVKSGRVGLLS